MKIVSSSHKSLIMFALSFALIVGTIAVAGFTMRASPSQSGAVSWGLKYNEQHSPPDGDPTGIEILNANRGRFVGDENQKNIYLTFDLGYEAGFTADVLDTLAQKNVRAIFFLTGHYLESEPDLVRRMIDEGHFIGNHSYNHLNADENSVERVREDTERIQAVLHDEFGVESIFYRPPSGVFTNDSISHASSLGLTTLLWGVAYQDWGDYTMERQAAVDKLMGRIHPGAIVLLHLANETNPDMLPYFIGEVIAQGYAVGCPSELVMD